jgi:hypothetical protein
LKSDSPPAGMSRHAWHRRTGTVLRGSCRIVSSSSVQQSCIVPNKGLNEFSGRLSTKIKKVVTLLILIIES